ncbi:MAG: sodium:proton antiporter [Planctomyces sp.]|nr:sodium:proton antiporter [Planctomyces sp.]
MLLAVDHVNQVEALMLVVLQQLVVMIAAARLGGWFFRKLGQPTVVGEIAAGLILGPSVVGRLFPGFIPAFFPTDVTPIFQTLGQLGLIFLMFLIGMEFDFGHLRKMGRTAGMIGASGIALPFAGALALGWWMQPLVAMEIPRYGFALFMATACSVTAIPILGRIMIEFGINRTRLGALTISAAAMVDALIWIMLATVAAIVRGNLDLGSVAAMLGLTIGLVAVVLFVIRPLVVAWIARLLPTEESSLNVTSLALWILVIFAMAMITNWIGIFSIIGPFLLGAALHDQHRFREAFAGKTQDFVYSLLLPVFFTYTGLRTDIGTLNTPLLWALCGLVCLVAIGGKIIGCGAAARLGGLSWPESGCVAIMMNTRALMGLIAINVGREMGVIPPSVFCMLIIMAVLTTFMTSPILRRLLPLIPAEDLGQQSSREETIAENGAIDGPIPVPHTTLK